MFLVFSIIISKLPTYMTHPPILVLRKLPQKNLLWYATAIRNLTKIKSYSSVK